MATGLLDGLLADSLSDWLAAWLACCSICHTPQIVVVFLNVVLLELLVFKFTVVLLEPSSFIFNVFVNRGAVIAFGFQIMLFLSPWFC